MLLIIFGLKKHVKPRLWLILILNIFHKLTDYQILLINKLEQISRSMTSPRYSIVSKYLSFSFGLRSCDLLFISDSLWIHQHVR